MIGEETKKHIEEAVTAEMNHGIEQHGEFHTHHEAIAVLFEELQEVQDCANDLAVKQEEKIPEIWESVKKDETSFYVEGDLLEEIKSVAMRGAEECVQVAAMCDKWIQKLKDESWE